ncbi:hypothetical protein AAG747_18215 [Rapidithrix thailandica]|uniref:Uncharacterized protein n=1 Tax=Rapidithrix thailandica TaxID=413964 RepID=A0AAW9SG73_9BACT
MILELEKLLDIDYEEFSKNRNKKFEKHFYSEPNEKSFSVFLKGDEYQFIDEKIASIEFRNFKNLKRKYNFKIKKSLEGNLAYLTKNKIEWTIFQKYSYDQYLVIKVSNTIYYEYEYEENKFNLNLIRVSNSE